MSIAHLLEDFGAFARGNSVDMTDVLLEENRLEAFEAGYRAGWDDSAKATSEEAGHVSAAFARTLSDLTVTYEEATAGVLDGLKPLIGQIVASVLPKVAQQTLGLRISEILQDLAAQHGSLPVILCSAPSEAPSLEKLVPEDTGLPISVQQDPTLIEGQVRVTFGNVSEQQIDLPGAIAAVSEAIDAHIHAGKTAS